ncbi:lysosome-associated membrane glycoprotein 2 isoform X1 [Austrofundulus limnaeus]|uniref:Lysosome-associated membrane glycoprotein 2 isoform X1 n=1 Tax=Austrofundulus limnaeus TaxID=52670 RepID=A0A2I4AVQ6_AUSLI|nr:PREDICTED: lysosome-associated membrane glycoprotein 2 isoform X1 [Austrofundulus limnaeus]
MYRFAAFAFLLFVGVVFHQSHGIEVNVTDKDKLCLYAKLQLNFTVSYEGNQTIHTNSFKLPENATTDGSECHDNSSTLKLNFGAGHSWSINFIKNGESYHAGLVTFIYNLSDTSYFPGASSNKTMNVSRNASITDVELNTCYSCNSNEMISADQVNMTLSNVLIQAFVINGSMSENITVCAADQPVIPTSPSTTTAAPTPTTPPTPLPTPQTGNYSVESNASVCLLANFGLRIGFKLNQKYHEMNFNPVGANVFGSCGFDSSELMLESEEMIVTFTFFNDTKKFHLHTLNVTVNAGFGFNEVKTNLSLWETNIGSSYMCNKEQNSTITDQLSLYTFNLRVQPFGVQKGVFSTAVDCQAEAESYVVPIAVGVALVILILIVVVAYFIGRRRNMASGYQSF